MTDATWHDVGVALLGSWPGQIAAWGEDGIQAYLDELQARGVDPDGALLAIRSCPTDQAFPPSAPQLAGTARHDPDRPTFDQLVRQLYGPGGVFGFKRAGVTVSIWVQAFVADYGRERLRLLEIDDPEYGPLRRNGLRESWEEFLEAVEGRDLHAIASGARRGRLGRVDPLAVLGLTPTTPELEAGS